MIIIYGLLNLFVIGLLVLNPTELKTNLSYQVLNIEIITIVYVVVTYLIIRYWGPKKPNKSHLTKSPSDITKQR